MITRGRNRRNPERVRVRAGASSLVVVASLALVTLLGAAAASYRSAGLSRSAAALARARLARQIAQQAIDEACGGDTFTRALAGILHGADMRRVIRDGTAAGTVAVGGFEAFQGTMYWRFDASHAARVEPVVTRELVARTVGLRLSPVTVRVLTFSCDANHGLARFTVTATVRDGYGGTDLEVVSDRFFTLEGCSTQFRARASRSSYRLWRGGRS